MIRLLVPLLLVGMATTAANAAQPKGERAVRTLEAITIEGEIDLPQVLFITARDQHRFRDKTHRNYLKNCAQVGSEAALPERVKPVTKEQ